MNNVNSSSFLQFSSNSLDEACNVVSSVFCPHVVTTSKDYINYRHRVLSLNNSSLSVMTYGEEISVLAEQLRGFYLLQLPLSGHDLQVVRGVEFLSDVRTATFHVPDSELQMNWSKQCKKIVFRIEQGFFERYFQSVLESEVSKAIEFSRRFSIKDPVFNTWLGMARHIFDAVACRPGILQFPLINSQFEQMLLSLFLSASAGSSRGVSRNISTQILPRHIKIAVDYIQANPEADVTIELLSGLTGTSERSIYEGFSKFLSVSPMKYLKKVRLECFRRYLLNPEKPRNVTEIATSLGFYQLGKLSGEYKAIYGETPRQTLQRAKH